MGVKKYLFFFFGGFGAVIFLLFSARGVVYILRLLINGCVVKNIKMLLTNGVFVTEGHCLQSWGGLPKG